MSQIYGLSVHLDGPSGKLDPNGGFQLQVGRLSIIFSLILLFCQFTQLHCVLPQKGQSIVSK